MEIACSTPPETAAIVEDTAAMVADRKKEAEETAAMVAEEKEAAAHKIKVVQFLGRSTTIVLQNDNGPCPLLAICNVLLLRNYLNLSPDVPEVSQEKLLSLVAERLIDSNSNPNNKDAEYVENQQQNIADAIDLLPRLTTGIDVNIKYRRIDDFEFTRECAIFDLLDIPLYHGWIVDPQDHETANAIGSKSYNTLMEELVALEAQSMKNELPKTPEEDAVDFAAATTATLGVPSPSIPIGRPLDDSTVAVPDESYPVSLVESHTLRKGDIEEDAELVRALRLSETELVAPSVDNLSTSTAHLSLLSEESTSHENSELDAPVEPVIRNNASYVGNDSGGVSGETGNGGSTVILSEKTICSSEQLDLHDPQSQSTSAESIIIAEDPDLFFQAQHKSTVVEPKENLIATSESYEHIPKFDMVQSQSTNISESGDMGTKPNSIDLLGSCLPPTADSKASIYPDKHPALPSDIANTTNTTNISEAQDMGGKPEDIDTLGSCLTQTTDSKASSCPDKPQALPSDIVSSEPIYEGEDCILDSKTEDCKNQEPVYEGEVILAEQVDDMAALPKAKSRSEMTVKEGEIVRNFLRSSASQLTVNGLFCLQECIKERELCVFFRNNHFNTMFKYEGELYILVTDQGYINQPDLVWEKLNEVNGDTLYMTGNFKKFKVDDHANSAWDEQSAMSSTADYLASIDTSAHQQSNVTSDYQLAVALQQQEFEQDQAQSNNDVRPQPISASSGLVTGPQVPRDRRRHSSTSSNSKPEVKPSKEKCTVM